MLDLIILIFLYPKIGRLAKSKGLSSRSWIWRFIGFWFAGEFIGIAISVVIFGSEVFPAILLGIGGGLASYFIIENHLSKLPNTMDDDINNIGG